ncbi:MAG: DAK2 domain-containing protein [Oscillospiraceae bacterium]|jgi:DAK2 domain fusion protein YloV|nr:DAK2 domain-containing protein [Oscillospiraceae bacterium]
MTLALDAIKFRDALISAANNIYKNRIHINELNIFPVPDGDTGTNMSLTILGVAEKVKECESSKLGDVVKVASSASLRSARGNSGVILSVIIKGMAEKLKDLDCALAEDLVSSLGEGVKQAYDSVARPTEGTMLTVARLAHEFGRAALEKFGPNNLTPIWEEVCEGARKALQETPDLLPVLKKAGVVDAGGKGLCLILEGMLSVFKDGKIIENDSKGFEVDGSDSFRAASDAFDGDITFTYCTECIVTRHVKFQFIPEKFRSVLEKIGDCVVVVNDNEIIKIHIHTNSPEKVLGEALKYGQLINVKVDNLEEQRKTAMEAASAYETQEVIESDKDVRFAQPQKNSGVVAVACDSGLIKIFEDMGVDQIVVGGQTMNPSADEIATAAMAVPAQVVYILPNNKNIIMAAQQAVGFVNDRKLIVLPSKTIPQGISAVMAYAPDASEDENMNSMTSAMKTVRTGQVTYAERDSEFNGFRIKKNDILALDEGKLVFVCKNPYDAAFRLIKSIFGKGSGFIVLIYGSEIEDQDLEMLVKKLEKKFPGVDLQAIYGGSEIYHFIISVE